MSGRADCDAVVIGASLAGSTSALLLARAGARVVLVERSGDPNAFKRICGHYIQASALPTLERAGLLEAIVGAGGVRSGLRLHTPWGAVEPSDAVPRGLNIRREVLDPLVRQRAAAEEGVELVLGQSAIGLEHAREGIRRVRLRDRTGAEHTVSARLVVGADGRGSKVAELAEVRRRVSPHGRFSYAAYYEGPPPPAAPDGQLWLLDPQWVAAFPTDHDLTVYACMPTKDRLPDFRRDLEGQLTSVVAGVPDPPPIRQSRRVSPILGKIEMPNVQRGPVAPGVALVGDAALATDPLWGVGCGWAFQTAEWMVEALAPALRDEEPLSAGLRRYRRRFVRGLGGHAAMIRDYAGGRPMNAVERLLFSAAVHDREAAARLGRYGTRIDGPQALLSPALGWRIAVGQARRWRARRRADDAGDLLAGAARAGAPDDHLRMVGAKAPGGRPS